MKLIVGLGNPGRRYQGTRHNIGFAVVDELARRHATSPFQVKFGGELTSGLIDGHKILFFKPMEFMNHSGFPVQRAAQFYGVDPESIVVIHDEIDLPLGRLRLKEGGGHGGHNGLRSIVAQLGSAEFLRVRCGIGKPERTDGQLGEGEVSGYVLSAFSAEQRRQAEDLTERAADATEAILKRGMRAAMNDFNGVSSS